MLTGLGPVSVRIPKARSQSRGAGGVSLAAGAAVRAPRQERGCGAAVAVLCTGCPPATCSEALGALLGPEAAGLSASVVARLKACVDGRVSALAPREAWQGSLGVSVGRRHLLGAARRGRAAVRAGGHRRERARPEAASWRSRTGCANPSRAGGRCCSSSRAGA